ncbi:MAG TPA: ASKHA domain-containing protein [Dongiaceae bacterium]|jgi:uncharacterized 2Fe-2S/4Fe-4S cluster protein (DUF4445 family)|nr:ASKHA domain-containing protein [Dongiaceae bacterium]
MNSQDALVVFMPSGRRGRFPVGTPLLKAARQLGVDIDSVCGGRGICGRCQVVLAAGSFPKLGVTSLPEHLSPIGPVEIHYAEKRGMAPERRLSCSALLLGDLVVDVPPDSQVHKQIVRKRAEARAIEIDPVVKLHYIDVAEPDMHDPRGDLQRLEQALAEQWQLTGLECDLRVLQGLQEALRKGGWKVTVAIHSGRQIIALWPGYRDRAYGMAVDIGSTTIAGHLCDLETGEVVASSGMMNPQIRFGEDLMSRVSYVMLHPGGEKELTDAVRAAINDLAASVARQAGLTPQDILEACFVGNPIMHHLLLGISPVELGGAPFALATDGATQFWASEIALAIHPNARIFVLPCIAGHVGADTAGVLLSEAPQESEEMCLIVDVGTNAELVLGNKHRLLAASSPTGPAFEGAQISCGQRAAPGAIERVRIDPTSWEPRYKIIGCDYWSDDPLFEAEARQTGITGICGSGIIEIIAEMYLAGILSSDGVIASVDHPRILAQGRTFSYVLRAGDNPLIVTQNDVRAIQLAKAALYAGARLLMDRMGIAKVDRITLAGAFGAHIDGIHAMVLGMIPDCDSAKVTSAGNAAGTGARIALLNKQARQDIARLVKRVEKIETAIEPSFQEHFVAAMAIPHRDAAYEHLRRTVTLPERRESAAPAGRRRSRRQ